MSSNFGKEVGLIHKAILNGRSLGADTVFWSALADHKTIFQAIIPLVMHIAVAKERIRFNHDRVIDNIEEFEEEFESWYSKISEEFLENFESKSKDFWQLVTNKMVEIGLFPFELKCLDIGNMFILSEDETKIIGFEGRISLRSFIQNFKQLIVQRQYLASILS